MWKKLCGGKFWSLILQLCFAEEGWAISKIKEDLWTTGSLVCQINSKDRCYKSYTVSTAWWGAWQINNSSFIRLINRILILQIAFFKKKKKTRCRPEAPLERLTPLKIEVDIKKIISTVKAVKLGFFKLLNLHEDVRSSNQPRLCFVYHLHYYNISRATSWLEGVRGGALKMWYFNRVYIWIIAFVSQARKWYSWRLFRSFPGHFWKHLFLSALINELH